MLNRQQDVHLRGTDPATDGVAPRRIGRMGLTIAIGVIAVVLLVLIVAIAR